MVSCNGLSLLLADVSETRLAGIYSEQDNFALHPPFCADFRRRRGLVIAYRILQHSDMSEDDPEAAADTFKNLFSGGSSPVTAAMDGVAQTMSHASGPMLMVVVPGLFHTLDTLERALLPLRKAHPGLTLLLVAPPGLQNTHWPRAAILGGEVRAFTSAILPLRCFGVVQIRIRWSRQYLISSSGEVLHNVRPCENIVLGY